jgi:hypothetical protein
MLLGELHAVFNWASGGSAILLLATEIFYCRGLLYPSKVIAQTILAQSGGPVQHSLTTDGGSHS